MVDMCQKSGETCPNQPVCQLLGPWREDLLGTGGLHVGTELLLWHSPTRKMKYFLLMYGWYLLPLLLLLGAHRVLIPSLWFFFFALLPALYGAFRLQCRFFGSRTGRKALQMKYRIMEAGEDGGGPEEILSCPRDNGSEE